MDKIPPPALLPLAHALNAKAVHIHVLIRVFLAPFVGSFIGAAASGKVAAVAGVIAFARSQAPHFADLFAGVVYMWLIGFIIGLFAAGITSLMGIPLVVLCRRGRILDALIVMVFAFLISICVYN